MFGPIQVVAVGEGVRLLHPHAPPPNRERKEKRKKKWGESKRQKVGTRDGGGPTRRVRNCVKDVAIWGGVVQTPAPLTTEKSRVGLSNLIRKGR